MKQIKILLTLLSLLLAQPTFGMEKSVLFTVDLEKLLKFSNPGKSIILANNMARQALQNENEKLETELLSEEKEISELRKTLSIDEFRVKALDFDKRVTIIRKEQAEKEKLLVEKVRKEEANFLKRIYPLLYELLSDKGGSVLIDQRNVILWENSVDITNEAINVINRFFDSSISDIEKKND